MRRGDHGELLLLLLGRRAFGVLTSIVINVMRAESIKIRQVELFAVTRHSRGTRFLANRCARRKLCDTLTIKFISSINAGARRKTGR